MISPIHIITLKKLRVDDQAIRGSTLNMLYDSTIRDYYLFKIKEKSNLFKKQLILIISINKTR